MERVTLGQLLNCYDEDLASVERIQIITGEHSWDEPDELFIDSKLLFPFFDWKIICLSCEKSFCTGQPLIRAEIKAA